MNLKYNFGEGLQLGEGHTTYFVIFGGLLFVFCFFCFFFLFEEGGIVTFTWVILFSYKLLWGWGIFDNSKLLEKIQNLFAVYTSTFDQSHIFMVKMSLHLKYIIQAAF